MLLYLGNQHASVRAANLHRIVYRRQDDFPIATFRRRVKTNVNYRAYNLGYTSFYFLLHTISFKKTPHLFAGKYKAIFRIIAQGTQHSRYFNILSVCF
jgi:hypothetical protein